MIEMLADPLIHIIRNSLDHGIETPATRKEAGKSESGEIIMRAYPESDRVMIEIIDNGKGIDSQMVVNKVLEKGLIDPDKLDDMSENEKLNLIMLPGLSTVEAISEYSGRGVGMDVVKKSIEGFGGEIHLESVVGKGTKLVMSIPVSLAVTTLLHVSMNEMHYGFPMDSVSETVKISKESITILNNEYYIYLRGEIIPLVVIGEMMDMSALDSESISLVVLDVKGSQMAVVVNDLLGQLSVVQKPMQGLLSDHSLIGGTALLGNGQIMMIIDPVSLWEVSDALGTSEVLEEIVA
jgi:two-component system chemotaxis sensor kinase CheA